VHYTQGYIFHNSEIFFVPAFSFLYSILPQNYGLEVKSAIISEKYGSGQIYPAYDEKLLIFTTDTGSPEVLKLNNLIYRKIDSFLTEIGITEYFLQKIDAKVITNINLQTLIINIRMLSGTGAVTTAARIYGYQIQKNDFLGTGKIINNISKETLDISIYRVGAYLIILRPYDPAPATTNDTITWQELWNYSFAGYDGPVPSNIQVYLSVNLTHEKI
jgi:hypothetical protein